MDSSLAISSTQSSSVVFYDPYQKSASQQSSNTRKADSATDSLEKGTFDSSSLIVPLEDEGATVGLSADDITLGLSVTAQKIQEKLRELLNGASPQARALGFDPDRENITSESTADTIVQGIALLFERFKTQNPSLEGEELVNEFFSRAKEGVEKGYSDAYETLQGLGAFELGSVKGDVEETKILIDRKLQALEDAKRESLGLPPKYGTTTSSVSPSGKPSPSTPEPGLPANTSEGYALYNQDSDKGARLSLVA